MALMKQLANRLNFKLPGRDRKTIRKERLLANIILVGTHHKTGTVWMYKIFREIVVELNMRFFSGTGEAFPS